ncbi:serine/threonine-protein kinase [Pseudofrankia inefficax]|uniref:non-specific serine/threonine protein kinase n=1 Tax=Pseudofrankia inefficax (strain DSM 45817 / CECT 9037 / DDB 130130 / EuI1c) TaxID=298654 RepID=E3IYM9_PSEI1|nr:serine/threonine-protein kinase [Pseudofrankia inefficax]ADP85100.1 serine/threonine protein kinase [Pseudofrankia inefficax]
MEAALPGYQVEGDLGKGGYGLVLAGQHRLIGRKVAIKILLDTSDDPELRARFLAEARVLAELDHPHIVRVHDYVEHEGTCLLVMELLPGGTLKQRIQAGKINQETVCAVGIAAAAALTTAHAADVLHRDVKPDNIMFDGAGLLKVTDFGIAKIFDGAETTASAILGTPRYMAPEQILGGRLFPSTDLYALAGVLYEMLAERPLFGRPMGVQPLTHHHLNVMPDPLTMAPPQVAGVIMRTLAKDPAARLGDATEFALELARASVAAFGPAWLTRSDVKIRVDDEIREAALGTTSTPSSRFSGPPVGPPRPAGPQTPLPGTPGFPGYGPTGPPRPNQQFPPRPGMPTGPGYQPGPGRPVPTTGRPFTGTAPVGTPGGWSAPPATPQPTPPGPTPPAAPLPTPGYRPPAAGGWPPGGAPPVQPRPPQPMPPRPPLVPQPVRTPLPTPHRGQPRKGLFGLSLRTTLITATLLFVLIAGLTTAIALAFSRGGGGGGSGGDGVNTAQEPYPDRTRGLPATAIAYSGPTLTVPNLAPLHLFMGTDGSVYVSSLDTNIVHRISKDGTVTPIAGNGTAGFSGDGGPATSAELNGPGTAVVDKNGNIYVPDTANNRIRKITPDGKITTVVGNGTAGFSGDGGPATQAEINSVEGIAVGPDGSLYLADYSNERIRKVTPDGIISTIAGTGTKGYTSTPTPALSAQISDPNSVVIADDGTIYIGNLGSDSVQKIGKDGILSPFAGNGKTGRTGDGGDAANATLSIPDLALGPDGTVYISNYGSDTVRKVTPDGVITTIAGTGAEGNTGDGGPATAAQLKSPSSVVVDASGAVYIADNGNKEIRRVDPNGTISLIARQAS